MDSSNQRNFIGLLRIRTQLIVGTFSLLLNTVPASAHPAHMDGTIDFQAGAQHPFTGLDHTLAMLAVGLIAWRLGGKLRWALPLAFVIAMAVGGAVATLLKAGTPGIVEQIIAASVVVFGLMLVAIGRVPAWSALVLIPAFATFHGYAHLSEGVGQAGYSALGYTGGMTASSIVLLAIGMGMGAILCDRTPSIEPQNRRFLAVRVVGGMVATVGLVLLAGTF